MMKDFGCTFYASAGGAMTNRDWYDDSDYRSAVEQAERMTRVGWKTIGAVTGLLGIAVIGVVVACLAVAVAVAYAVVARH